jgi:uncharacterized protein YjbI with pentapeptide repeats
MSEVKYIQITTIFTGDVIYAGDAEDLSALLVAAAKSGANLSRADLYGANLSGADMSRANLSGANLSGASIDGEKLTKAPLGVSGLRWWILVTDGYMRIGCQRHTHSEWADMSDKQISDMDSAAAEFWLLWKAPLLSMCAAHAVGLSSDPSKEK